MVSVKVECDGQILAKVNYYCRAMCDVPQTFKEAMSSSKSEKWASTMKEEMDSLWGKWFIRIDHTAKGQKCSEG